MSRLCALAVVSALLSVLCFSASASDQQENDRPKFPHIGVGLKMSTLGAGVEIATPITQRTNLRLGFNNFAYAHNLRDDGSLYTAKLNLFSVQANYDWYPFNNSFHLSPGVAYNGNHVKAGTSDNAAAQAEPGVFPSPITGSARIDFARYVPMFLIGWGNLIPHRSKRFSIPFEFGAAYHGQPRASLHMNPIVCPLGDVECYYASLDPSIQSSFVSTQTQIRKEIAPYKFYPVISLGFGYRF